ncbi:sigma-54 interaction domain-containing protein [Palleronia abyssalis]|nr:sigma 54-interacting transcriptional regulator [Palleronia abyssalis]
MTALHLNPLAAMTVDLPAGGVGQINDDARTLFGGAPARIAQIAAGPASDLAVFFEAVRHYGRYVDTALEYRRLDGAALRLQVIGIDAGKAAEDRIVLSFLDLDAQRRRAARDEERDHQRGGLLHWQRIYGFFREVETNNHLILEAAGEGIYGINADGKATFVNRAAQKMLGWDAQDLIGRDLHQIIHHSRLGGAHFPAHDCPIYQSFRRDKTVRIDDDAFWRKDGRPIFVEYVSTPIYDHGVLAGAVVIFRDVTERRENEKKLRDALAEVEALRGELEQENAYLLTEIKGANPQSGLIGTSPATRNLEAQIALVADTKTNVLVSGPAGSGKSLVVAAIHDGSDRRKRPLVRLACSDISAGQLEREFFGYRKGAFPGAMRDTVGKIALAANGSLHLDEVSDLPRDFQAQLMEVLRRRAYRRIGDLADTPLDLRIISTTVRDLSAEVQAGRFRQDLYFALSVFPMRCEPLRDRPEDIPHLAQHFLDASTRRLKLPRTTLTKANVAALRQHHWPGNVRELENLIERAAILAQGRKLSFEFQEVRPAGSEDILTAQDLKSLERDNLLRCLKRAGGKVSGARGAAALLGLPATTVYSQVRSFGITESDWSG